MRSLIVLSCALTMMFASADRAEATTYTRLVEALREQKANPGPEADAKVRQTQVEAAIFHSTFYIVPALLIGYLLFRLCTDKKHIK